MNLICHIIISCVTKTKYIMYKAQDYNVLALPHYFFKGDVWAIKASLTSTCFIEVSVPSQESERPCICVRGIDFVSLYDFDI